MKKILMLHRGGSGGVRGTEICLVQAAEGLHRAGFEVQVGRNLPVVDDQLQPFVSGFVPLQMNEIYISLRRWQLPLLSYWREFRRLSSIIRSLGVDCIYCSGGLPCQLGVPLGRLFRIPVVCHFHHPATKPYYRNWLVKYADRHIVPSRFTGSNMREAIGIDPLVIYNGIDAEAFSPAATRDPRWRAQHGIPADAVVIGQVGQLIPHKRPDLLLRAFSEAARTVPRLHLCLVGRGPMEAELKRKIAELGMEARATVTGFVESVQPYYQHVFDINALVSSEEGLGISVLEGSASGLPVVATDCTGLSETVVQGETGFLVPIDAADELVRRIVELAGDAALRRRMGAAGRERILAGFSLQRYQEGVVGVVESVLGPARDGRAGVGGESAGQE